MRKSRYGNTVYCDACGYVLPDQEQRVLKRVGRAAEVHLRCLSPIDRTRALVKLGGTWCLFCGRQMLLPDLMDHFNARHGVTVRNW